MRLFSAALALSFGLSATTGCQNESNKSTSKDVDVTLEDATSANMVCSAEGVRFAIDSKREMLWEVAPAGELSDALKEGVPMTVESFLEAEDCSSCFDISASLTSDSFTVKFRFTTTVQFDEAGKPTIEGTLLPEEGEPGTLVCKMN